MGSIASSKLVFTSYDDGSIMFANILLLVKSGGTYPDPTLEKESFVGVQEHSSQSGKVNNGIAK
jgi:hypothetical protein